MNAVREWHQARPALHPMGDLFAEAWRGVPFRWDGRSQAGVDCWGLVMLFHEIVKGEALPDWARRGEARGWIARTIAGETRSHWQGLPGPADGCIVKALAHVGIYWRGDVLHADEARGVVLERLGEFLVHYPGAEFGEFLP